MATIQYKALNHLLAKLPPFTSPTVATKTYVIVNESAKWTYHVCFSSLGYSYMYGNEEMEQELLRRHHNTRDEYVWSEVLKGHVRIGASILS